MNGRAQDLDFLTQVTRDERRISEIRAETPREIRSGIVIPTASIARPPVPLSRPPTALPSDPEIRRGLDIISEIDTEQGTYVLLKVR